ncbi:MAG: transposase [Dehalococcoidia bacterium]
MIDPDTFLTILYVMADDFCKYQLPSKRLPGPRASLTRSEVVTLALFAQWEHFPSERAFYRYASTHLRGAFPTLPNRGQFNRLMRRYYEAIVAFYHHLVALLQDPASPYEALDSSAVPTRDAKRRGTGWLAGQADIGWSNRLGWYEGFHLLASVTPQGVITGFSFAPASAKDQALAEDFFACRYRTHPRMPTVGSPPVGYYVLDKGFEGKARQQHWLQDYAAPVVCPPKRNSQNPWPKRLRRWVAGVRQIVETVFGKLHHTFRLDRERPHALTGFQSRLAAKVALHNFCIWLNRQMGRQSLAFAELLQW